MKHFLAGDFHLEMNAIMKTMEVMMPSTSSKNQSTLGQLASRLVIAHRVSNDPAVIKKSGNYEENRQFPALVGLEMLREGLAMYKAECEASNNPVIKDEVWLKDFYDKFLATRQIRLWFDPEDKPSFFDDMNAYAANLVSRMLLHFVHRHAVKYGDPVTLRACHIIYTLFFYAHNGNRSKYCPSLLNQLADYKRLCSRDKMMVDLICSINCTGEEGTGAAADKVNEWAVCEVKSLYDRFGNNYEVTLIDRAMKANNMIAKMKNEFLCALGEAELAGKIKTSQD